MPSASAASLTSPESWAELRKLIKLGLPIMFTQLSQMGMSVADAIMAGQVGALDLAGVSLGGALFWPAMLLISGLVMSVSPSVSQLHGSGRVELTGEVVRQALWLALAGGLAGFVFLSYATEILTLVGIDPRGIPAASAYAGWLKWGLLPVLGYFTLRYLCDGLSWTLPAMLIAGCALLLKIPLNYLFIYGGFGLEPMGGTGCGPATVIVMTAEFIAMLCVVRFSRINKSGLYQRFSAPDWAEIKRLLLLGLPIGLAIFFEMAIFSILTLLVGRIGIEAVAAHQIASNVGGITFMIPLALGMAATIRVGYNVGRGDYVAARRSGLLAIGLSLLFAACAAGVLLGFRGEIVALYTQDPEVLITASTLLLFIVLYQPFDDTQVTAIGALRGYKDTRFPMVVALLCYWGVALPIGVGLGFGLFGLPQLGVSGFWWALVVGLALASVVLLARFQWLSRRADVIAAMAKR